MKKYDIVPKAMLQKLVSNVKEKLASVAFTGKLSDADNDMSFSPVIPLTKAEWEELPDTKYTDGKMYLVDDGSEESPGNPWLDLSEAINGVVLWENPNPSVEFVAQNGLLTENINNYDYVEIAFKFSKDNNQNWLTTGKTIVCENNAIRLVADGSYTRAITFEGDAWAFGDCKRRVDFTAPSSESTTHNSNLIPYQIIGYKKAEFNPINGILPPADKVTFDDSETNLGVANVQDAMMVLIGFANAMEKARQDIITELAKKLNAINPEVQGTLMVGDNVKLFSDNEGGNIQLIGSGGRKWEIDTYNDNLRFFNYSPDGSYPGFSITKDGYLAFKNRGSGTLLFCKVLFLDGDFPSTQGTENLAFTFYPGTDTLLMQKVQNADAENPYSASICIYNYASTNWCGMGCHQNGSFWVKVGVMTGFLTEINALTGVMTGAGYSNTSSIRYKENVEDLTEEEAEKILDIRPVTFNFKNTGRESVGVIAEEVEEIIPKIVTRNQDGEPEGVEYVGFIPYLIKMVQMQQEQIEALREEIEILKKKGD